MKFSPIALVTVLASTVAANDDKDGWSGVLSTLDGGLKGTVKVVNSSALVIDNYSVDPSAPALYWWGATDSDLPGGFRISNMHVTEKPTGDTGMIALDAGHTTDDFSVVGLYCEKLKANFGQATLTKDGKNSSSDSSDSSKGDTSGAAGRTTGLALIGSVLFTAGAFFL